MAAVTKSSVASIDAASALYAPQISEGLVAGETLAACDACYIKQADNKVYRTSGAAANEAAVFAGFCPRNVPAGQPVTLFAAGVKMEYGSAAAPLTPGQKLYLGTTAGGLDTAATTGDAVGVAQAITSRIIRCTRMI